MPAHAFMNAKPRSELIADFGSRVDGATATALSPHAAVAPSTPAADLPKTPTADPPKSADADTAVSAAVDEVKSAIAKALAAQKADPDSSDPNDEKVLAGLTQLSDLVDSIEKDQAADVAGEVPPAKPATPPPPVPAAAAASLAAPALPPAAAKSPQANPVDEDGNIDSQAVCANPDCQHLASSHLNDDSAGENTGACQMSNCECLGMTVEAEPNTGTGGNQSTDPPSPASSEELALAVPDAPVPPGPAATSTPPNLNAPPASTGSENMGPAFTIPVAVIEGQPTGDGREISPQALTWRIPPLPLMGLATSPHDPEGFSPNDPAVMCGRIDGLARTAGEDGTQLISAHGYYLANDDGQYFAGLTEAMGRCGISADIAVLETEMTVEGVDADGWPEGMSEMLTKGVISGLTQCPFPAFEGAYVVLGDGSEQPTAQPIPQSVDDPPVMDKPPAAVTAGGQLIHWMAYEVCEPCEQGLEVIVASGAGPTRPPKAWFENPNFQVGDDRLKEILDRRGKRAFGGKYACPTTVTADGRVFGHLAPWGVCHTGQTGACILAPHSNAGYAHYLRGQHIETAEGDKVRVGVITADTGHAPLRGLSAASAAAHYDNTALAVADVAMGEDEHGIWFAGAVRPDATDEQIRKLTAASISGDWREIGGSLELVAALAVNQPGFPLAVVASGHLESLVAAGVTVMDRLKHPFVPEPEPGDVVLRHALAPLLGDAKARARERIGALG